MTSKEIIDAVFEAFPELGPNEIDDDWVREELTYLVYSDFQRWVAKLLEDPSNAELVQRCFGFLEALTDDDDARPIVALGFLENMENNFGPNSETLRKAISFMGAKTLYLLRGVDAFWSQTAREYLDATPNPWPGKDPGFV